MEPQRLSARAGPTHTRRLAWASIVVGVLAWVPLAIVLAEDAGKPPAAGEIQGMAAIGAVLSGLAIFVCGALIGTVLAVLALRRPAPHRLAWAGLAINAIPPCLLSGFVAVQLLRR